MNGTLKHKVIMLRLLVQKIKMKRRQKSKSASFDKGCAVYTGS